MLSINASTGPIRMDFISLYMYIVSGLLWKHGEFAKQLPAVFSWLKNLLKFPQSTRFVNKEWFKYMHYIPVCALNLTCFVHDPRSCTWMRSFKIYGIWLQAIRKQASKQASIHTPVRNAVTLVWGLLSLAPINFLASGHLYLFATPSITPITHKLPSLHGTTSPVKCTSKILQHYRK